jgi:hypothetical protein
VGHLRADGYQYKLTVSYGKWMKIDGHGPFSSMIFNDFHSKSCVNSMAMLVCRRVVLDEWIMDGLHG